MPVSFKRRGVLSAKGLTFDLSSERFKSGLFGGGERAATLVPVAIAILENRTIGDQFIEA